MKFKLVFSFLVLVFCVGMGLAQTELTIKKKTSFNFPGMEMLPAGTKKEMDETLSRNNTVYIKGSKMRTDMVANLRKRTGSREKVTYSNILRCDQQRIVSFNSKKKKYYQDDYTYFKIGSRSSKTISSLIIGLASSSLKSQILESLRSKCLTNSSNVSPTFPKRGGRK